MYFCFRLLILPLSAIFLYLILELFRQWGICVFHFILCFDTLLRNEKLLETEQVEKDLYFIDKYLYLHL